VELPDSFVPLIVELRAVVSNPDAIELPDSLIEAVPDAAELPSCVVELPAFV